MLQMEHGPRIYYTEAQNALMWDRWQKGDSLETIGENVV
jgi:IS30 family transposase